jgi:hypothetical protein
MSKRRIGGLLALLGAMTAIAAPARAYPETWVTYSALLAEVRHGDLVRVIINPLRADVEIKFRNLEEWHAYYPRAGQRELQRLVDERHIPLKFVRRRPAGGLASLTAHPSAVHHHLRYVAAVILGVLVLAGGALHLLRGRRRAHSPPRAT